MHRVTIYGGSIRVDGDTADEARAAATQAIIEDGSLLHVVEINPDDPIEQIGAEVEQHEAMQVMRGLTKALLARCGGDVELSVDELNEASLRNTYFDGSKDPMELRFVEGDPPETPRFVE